jgi:hypothetical protein
MSPRTFASVCASAARNEHTAFCPLFITPRVGPSRWVALRDAFYCRSGGGKFSQLVEDGLISGPRDAGVAYPALRAQQNNGRHMLHPVIVGHGAADVEQHGERPAGAGRRREFRKPRAVHAHRDDPVIKVRLAPGKLSQVGHLFPPGVAPEGPKVQQDRLPA